MDATLDDVIAVLIVIAHVIALFWGFNHGNQR